MRRLLRLFAFAALAAALAPSARAAGAEGFLYGRVTTRDGVAHEGRLRWDDEEAFWGDFFNSAKEDNPWVKEAPRHRSHRRHTIEIFGIELGSYDDDGKDDTRQFISRFGDIARIEPQGGDRLRLTLKSGSVLELEGGSNDVEAKINVWDASGEDTIEWRRIRSIEFLPAPASLAGVPRRLYGKVSTRAGVFTGFVQWDQDECLGTDELDGETADGDDESVRMDRIRSIERRSSRSSTVVLEGGRELVLSGTNDVDSSNRGIYVDDARYGRVLVPWDEFDRVDFSDGGSGPGYNAYVKGERLAGTVTTAGGKKLTGFLVYDLDESETTELLNGERHDIEYSIPFALVATVVPHHDSTRVTLVSGEEISLEDSTDVTDDNAGVLVFAPGSQKPVFVDWEDVERIDFAGRSKK
jgi:hypothetical protein